ncbi:Bro-N domain-containing protein [Stenotrophomonas sp. LARHCG68]
MNNVIPFQFDNIAVRAMEIDGAPWFVAKDVAVALGYANPRKAVRDHCKNAQPAGGSDSFLPGLDPQAVIINEPDLYRLVVKSQLPDAQRFERWVFEEVLPTIRKTGSYGAAKPAIKDPRLAALVESLIRQDAIEQEQTRQSAEIARLQEDLAVVEARTQPENKHFTVMGYANLIGVSVDIKAASTLGRRCAALSKERGTAITDVPDPRFGRVHAYHESILQEVLQESH